MTPNPAVDPAPSGRWTLRDKAAQRRSPLRWGGNTVTTHRLRVGFFVAAAALSLTGCNWMNRSYSELANEGCHFRKDNASPQYFWVTCTADRAAEFQTQERFREFVRDEIARRQICSSGYTPVSTESDRAFYSLKGQCL